MKDKRILAKDIFLNNNSYETNLNNNDVIVGPSGSGKTRGYVLPNILQATESIIVTDTKNSLYQKTAGYLQDKGYIVHKIDFTGNTPSTIGYNSMDYIRYRPKKRSYENLDIMKLARIICPNQNSKDPFWDEAAYILCASMITCIMNQTVPEDHNLNGIMKIIQSSKSRCYENIMREMTLMDKNDEAVKLFSTISAAGNADKMIGSIYSILANHVESVNTESIRELAKKKERIFFPDLGKQKTALFVNVSDSDRSSDTILSIFYSQALQSLITAADMSPTNRLSTPVRFIFDDFASGAPISNFDNIISVIRSREIYASIIIQSLSQLNAIYASERAKTIINNCDHMLYLGGQDHATIQMISKKANRSSHDVADLPINKCLFFERGSKCIEAERYDISQHPEKNKLDSPIHGHDDKEDTGEFMYDCQFN